MSNGKHQIGYLGPAGTYSERAARAVVQMAGAQRCQVQPCTSLAQLFDMLAQGQIDYAVAPIENSLEGSIHITLDRLLYDNLEIQAECTLDIHHALLAPRGVAATRVTRVFSHPQALAQCRQTLRQLLPHAEQLETTSTAAAVSRVAEAREDDRLCACVAALETGVEAGLAVLREHVEDRPGNQTRFALCAAAAAPPLLDRRAPEPERCKTSIVLQLGDDHPGALVGALQSLAQSGINLTKLESRPTREPGWSYSFFLDLLGHPSQPEVEAVLQEIRLRHELALRVIGAYPCYSEGSQSSTAP